MQNGVLLIGVAAGLALAYTRGSIGILVVMYSINVFATFSLSEMGMVRFWIRHRKTDPHWKKHLPVHATGLVLCMSILVVMLSEKLKEGGWITLVVTMLCISLCFVIRRHYRSVVERVREVESSLEDIPAGRESDGARVRSEKTHCGHPGRGLRAAGYSLHVERLPPLPASVP